ncbi:uncharacterized protein [Nicotiana sylvestris]|uniref:uncharacterized protein n=1 Tax=Nicotiana sylvestris TaxID=4096 RepID=UPI00388C7A95
MSFLGRFNYISRFISQSTVICEPIFKILKKDVATKWTDDCQKAFDRTKEYLSTQPVLVPLEPGRPLLLYLAVLVGAFGCVLGQHDETGRKEQAIYYLSKTFTLYEARYSLLERTCCALTWKAVKGQALVDHLAENPVGGEYEPLKTYFPDGEVAFIGEDIVESYDGWRMFFDGAANFNRVGIGAVLELRKRFRKTEFQHVPRIQNEFADALATLSSMIQHPYSNFIDPIQVKIHHQPAYCAHVEEEVDGKPWFHDIIEYLTTREYPELARSVRSGASYKEVTKNVVADFVRDRMVCRFEIPESIIIDNGSNLNSDLMKAMHETFKIKHKNSMAYRPQMNGAVEAANKNIKKILRKMIERHK